MPNSVKKVGTKKRKSKRLQKSRTQKRRNLLNLQQTRKSERLQNKTLEQRIIYGVTPEFLKKFVLKIKRNTKSIIELIDPTTNLEQSETNHLLGICFRLKGDYTLQWTRDEIIHYLSQRPSTTREIMQCFIKPLAQENIPYITSLEDKYKSKCTDFVSHAWDDKFEDLVLALRENAQLNPTHTFVYFIDIFCIAQRSNFGESYFFDEFFAIMNACKRQILVMRNLPDPVLLSRSWCVYEIYCAIKLKKTIVVTQTRENWLRYEPHFFESMMPKTSALKQIISDATENGHQNLNPQLIAKVNDYVNSLSRGNKTGFFLVNHILSNRLREYAKYELLYRERRASRIRNQALKNIPETAPSAKRADSVPVPERNANYKNFEGVPISALSYSP